MERTQIKSSLLKSIGYDAFTKVFEVEFLARQSEPMRRVYQYENVPATVAQECFEAKSVGSFFLTRIKPNYKCKRIEEKNEEHKEEAAAPPDAA